MNEANKLLLLLHEYSSNYEVENYKQYIERNSYEDVIWKNKEIMTKQQEKSLPHYESEHWKGQWSENKLKINVTTWWHETFERKMWHWW